MVFPTLVGPREIAEVGRRIAKPIMIVNNAEEQHASAQPLDFLIQDFLIQGQGHDSYKRT